MIFYKSNLIYGLISGLLKTLFKAIYKILTILNMQYALLVAFIGVVLLVCGVMEKEWVKVLFYIALYLTLMLGLILSIKKLFKIGKKKIEEKRNSKSDNQQEETQEKMYDENNEEIDYDYYNKSKKNEEKPVYYKVKGKAGYYMAEYSDRYELLRNENGELKKIRTDFKG